MIKLCLWIHQIQNFRGQCHMQMSDDWYSVHVVREVSKRRLRRFTHHSAVICNPRYNYDHHKTCWSSFSIVLASQVLCLIVYRQWYYKPYLIITLYKLFIVVERVLAKVWTHVMLLVWLGSSAFSNLFVR